MVGLRTWWLLLQPSPQVRKIQGLSAPHSPTYTPNIGNSSFSKLTYIGAQTTTSQHLLTQPTVHMNNHWLERH